MIRIERIAAAGDPSKVRDIAAFVATHPYATAHAMPTWLAAMERFIGGDARYEVAVSNERIVGVLPIVERPIHARATILPKSLRPMRCESLGHDCYAGPLIDGSLPAPVADDVLRALVESIEKPGNVLSSLFPPAWADLERVRERLVSEHGYRSVRGYPIGVKPLNGLTQATLPGTYAKNHRNAADAAKRRGVVVSPAEGVGEYLEFYDLLEETMEHAGITTRYSKDFVVEAGRELVGNGLGELFLARVEGRPIAGVFVLHASKSACYWLGATAKDERSLKFRPMNAIFPCVFAHAIALGCEWFELGGLMTDGLRAFKTGWGAREYIQPTFERSYRDLAEPLREARVRLQGMMRRRTALS